MRITLLLVLFPFISYSSNLRVSEVSFDRSDYTIKATISWENAWRNSKNYDAAWIFLKSKQRGYVRHLSLDRLQPEISFTSNRDITVQQSLDKVGLLVYLSESFRGNLEVNLEIKPGQEAWEYLEKEEEILVYGIELVYIPEGPFTLGEPGTAYLEYGGLYESNANGEPAGLYRIESGDQEIPVGKQEGSLYYKTKTKYEGDQLGPIPASFPNGYEAFYIMKYEPTQGQYADFLNTLSEQQSHHRANFGGKTYYDRRGSIRLENDKYVAEFPDRPCNYMSWDDAMAFADWAGLRPVTELEYVKAARGPGEPVENEYPWNTGTYEQLQREMKESGNLFMPDESKLNDEIREMYGASYYWVMDLAGSMWERVITIGSEKGRQFKGEHGDGRITGYGFANVDDWPVGVNGPGFGFRGGGYYIYPMDFTEFNPYSPIAFRRYGGWAGGNRKEAYGARFGRTAD